MMPVPSAIPPWALACKLAFFRPTDGLAVTLVLKERKMNPAFRQFVEVLHPSFERLMQMVPLKMSALPSRLPEKCIYLLSEGQNHLYVGRTRKLRKRLRQHSIASAQHNQAVFAFKLARETTGQL